MDIKLRRKKFLNKYSSVSFLVGFLLLIGGCSDSPNSQKTGTMEVRMVDAPARYDEVNISIQRVEVRNAEADTTNSTNGWQVISEPNKTYNLLDLANGAYAVLGEAELEVGTYQQIRLILGDDNNVVIDGNRYDLKVPSGSQTGVKLNVDAEISDGINYTLLLDFDASRSVVVTGQGQEGNYLLKPVIKATNQAVSGNIAGTVSPVEAKAVIYAIADSDTLSSTYADTTDGTFKLVGLEEGNYTVSINPSVEGYAKKDTTGITVTVGETNDLGSIELAQI